MSLASGEASWVEVTVDGKSVVADNLTGAWSQTYTVTDSIAIQVSNVDAVTVTNNGKKVDFSSKTSGVGTLTIKGTPRPGHGRDRGRRLGGLFCRHLRHRLRHELVRHLQPRQSPLAPRASNHFQPPRKPGAEGAPRGALMAKESSFDVVSTVDMQEVDNAYQQAARELTQRYDLKGTGCHPRALQEGRCLQDRGPLGVCGEPGARHPGLQAGEARH